MKKKILGLGLVALLISLSVILTGCGEKTNDGTSSNNKKGNSREGLKVGDYVDYTYDKAEDYVVPTDLSGYKSEQKVKQENLRWQIFNIDEETGRVDLISTATTSGKLYMNGVAGYNNGVYLLNDIMEKQYSNAELGIKARSIKLEDFENKMNDEGKEEILNSITNDIRYGDTVTIESENKSYPVIYKEEIGSGIDSDDVRQDGLGISDQSSIVSGTTEKANKLTVKSTFFCILNNLNSFFDTEVYKLLYDNSSDFWIASRGADPAKDSVQYTFYHTYGKNDRFLGATTFCYTSGQDYKVPNNKTLRPIVSIDGNIKIEAKEGTFQNMHTISK